MTDSDKLRAQRARGERAQRILEDPLVAEAFEAIDREIIQGWRETTPDDHERREKAWIMSQLFRNLRKHFEDHIRTGENAKRELLAVQERKGRLRRMRKAVRSA